MADKNIQMQRRNVDNTAWEKLYPVTTAGNVNTVQGNTVQIQLDTLNNNVATAQNQLNTHANTVEKHRKITFGTTDPTGGVNGDIYIQYT